ncbi:MAG TPA: extracellular solute-binding protein [Micromonosporaceae bacterium]|nr:extracellular solute-binding protein [Micromonosporaceae bacterium]
MRVRTAVVISVLAVLLGSGCTGRGATPEPSASATPARTLVIWADAAQAGVLVPYAIEYGREHGLAVDVLAIGEDRQGRFLAEVASASGRAPDVVLGNSDWIGNLVRGDAIEPVPLSGDQRAAFPEIAMRAVTLGGQVYGVPYTVESVALIRNTDLTPVPPVTIEEAAAIGRQLKEAGKVAQPVGYPVGEAGDFRSVYPLYSSAGGTIFGVKDGGEHNTAELTVSNPESVEAFTRIAALGEKGAGALAPSVTPASALALFANGDTAYLVAGSEAIAEVKRAGIRYEVSAVPGFATGRPPRPLVGAAAAFVARKGPNRAMAQDFVTTTFTRADVAAALHRAQPRPPALVAGVEAIRSADPDAQKFLDVAKGGVALPAVPQMGPVWDTLGRAEAAVLAGADVPATVYDAAATIRTALR